MRQVMAQPSMHCSVQDWTADFQLGGFGQVIVSSLIEIHIICILWIPFINYFISTLMHDLHMVINFYSLLHQPSVMQLGPAFPNPTSLDLVSAGANGRTAFRSICRAGVVGRPKPKCQEILKDTWTRAISILPNNFIAYTFEISICTLGCTNVKFRAKVLFTS